MEVKQISQKKLKDFGLIIGFSFPLIIGFLIPFFWGHPFRTWTIFVGALSLILSLVKPKALYLPYKLWIKLGNILGWINSRIVLGIVFFCVLLPIAILMKILGYDPLNKNKLSSNTYKEYKLNHNIDINRIF